MSHALRPGVSPTDEGTTKPDQVNDQDGLMCQVEVRLSWKEVADAFGTSWDAVFRSVEYAVMWGLVARGMDGLGAVRAIGVDEIQWQRGHSYLTLVYQIDDGCRRLLWIGCDRTEKTLHGFFDLPPGQNLWVEFGSYCGVRLCFHGFPRILPCRFSGVR